MLGVGRAAPAQFAAALGRGEFTAHSRRRPEGRFLLLGGDSILFGFRRPEGLPPPFGGLTARGDPLAPSILNQTGGAAHWPPEPKTKGTTFVAPFVLEQVKGIEPSCSAWEADILPLNYTCILKLTVTFYHGLGRIARGKAHFFCRRGGTEKIHETFMISPCSTGEEWAMIGKTRDDRGGYR